MPHGLAVVVLRLQVGGLESSSLEENPVSISHSLENEGWERDYDVVEPTEPTFDTL
jgi:hypothetical protein